MITDSNTCGVGCILLTNQIAWLPIFVSQPKPIANKNQYDIICLHSVSLEYDL